MAYKTPNPDKMNGKRATAAAAALNKFAASPMGELVSGKLRGEGFDLRAQNLQDLLCDLAHYCDREEIHFADALRGAADHYAEETASEGLQQFSSELPGLRVIDPPAIKCPLCDDGELHSYSDMTENRAVVGYETKPQGVEVLLADNSDLNYNGDGDGIRCNSCDEEFYRDDVVAIVNGTFKVSA